MKKPNLILIAAITLTLFILLGVNLTSAALCKNSEGYYEECSDKPLFNYRYQGPSDRSSASYYNYNNYNSGSGSSGSSNSRNSYSNSNTNSYNSNKMPIFKGSYGNYRYAMYESGDYSPNRLFVDYPDYYPSYFSGGYYNYPYSSSYYSYGSYPFYSSYPYYGYGYGSYGYDNRYSGYYNYDSVYYSMPFFYGWF